MSGGAPRRGGCVRALTNRVPGPHAGGRPRAMRLSRLLLAAVIAVRAVLVYGEATSAASAELGWRDLIPARARMPRAARPAPVAAPARRYA